MLKTQKTINLAGQSIIEDTVAVYMNATLNESGELSTNKAVCNKRLYDENKVACRADIDAFEELAYALEGEAE